MNNMSDKDMVRAFIELTTDLKSRGFNPGYHIMDNEDSTELKNIMTIMEIKYQLVHPGNHRANNTEISIQTFKNHFV